MSFSVSIINQGCAANTSEGEQMAGLLAAAGYAASLGMPSDSTDPPQGMVLNLCTVKGNGSALKAVRQALDAWPGTPLVVTGCVTKELASDLSRFYPQVSIASTHALERIPEILKETISGKKITDLSKEHAPKLRIPRVRKNPVVGIVPIAEGCLDACTFCSTRLVKGRLKSYDPLLVCDEVQGLVEGGCKEIWLTAQDASCYGFDFERKSDLATLVEGILAKVNGNYKIRLGMGNPRHLLGYAEHLAELFGSAHLFRFLHLPVQSGSDSVLAKMGRRHNTADYYHLVDLFRRSLPDWTLTTDIIVGFPGETDADFASTLDLVRRSRPSGCNRTRFVSRPGTPAASLKEGVVHKDVKHQRSAELTRVFTEVALAANQEWVGRTTRILIDEVGKRGTWIGRNECYKPVAVRGDYKIGDEVAVRIVDAEPFALIGEAASKASM
jgi:MiaB-like tRNA modifying enzyme